MVEVEKHVHLAISLLPPLQIVACQNLFERRRKTTETNQ